MTPLSRYDRSTTAGPQAAAADAFARAADQLRSFQPRQEITITELPPPQQLAPFSYAVGAEVQRLASARPPPDEEPEIATGRLILLHDPAGQEGWQGKWRLVTYVTAELEPDLAADPLLPEVGWSWLSEALAAPGADHTALAGTVTQTTSTRFGELAGPPAMSDIEIRASWTPVDADLAGHMAAWCALLASTAGLPPPGVTALADRRG